MAYFIKLTDTDGQLIAVNIDRIRLIEPNGVHTLLWFERDHIEVCEPFDDVYEFFVSTHRI